MSLIHTQVQVRSAEAVTNAAAMQAAVDDLRLQIQSVANAAEKPHVPNMLGVANCFRVTVCRCCSTPVRHF